MPSCQDLVARVLYPRRISGPITVVPTIWPAFYPATTVVKATKAGGVPVGTIFQANGDIPAGYIECNGQEVSRAMFPDLFAVIGESYGSSDPTTFKVPMI